MQSAATVGTDAAGAQPSAVDPNACVSCGGPPESGFSAPLCAGCRGRLSRRGVPRWLGVSATALGAVVLFALVRFPSALNAGIAYERAQRADARGDFTTAYAEYSMVVKRFPDSTVPIIHMGLAAYHARLYPQAAQAFHAVAGRVAPPELVNEVNAAIDALDKLEK
jgi:hypothetical protein